MSERKPGVDRHLILHTDGASRGNPGPAAIGVSVLSPDGVEIGEISRAIGRATNNEAEYRAVLAGLGLARRLGASRVELCVDSELVGKHLLGEYKVRSAGLLPLYRRAMAALGTFRDWRVRIVPREQNRRADQLANQAFGSLS